MHLIKLKLTFFLVILFFPFFGKSEWIKLFSGRDGTVFYIDQETLKIKKNIRTISIMVDYKNPNIHGDYSLVINREINCMEPMHKDLEKKFFSENLGKGSLSRGSGKVGKPKWEYSAPGSSNGALIKFICNLN